mmetsp:Transcript_13848/g.35609  ORF Transcript_13848/g.35609 Transcript_13848/m.35609 type:complete len:223 (+) Transcript_13848:426-1094(+)
MGGTCIGSPSPPPRKSGLRWGSDPSWGDPSRPASCGDGTPCADASCGKPSSAVGARGATSVSVVKSAATAAVTAPPDKTAGRACRSRSAGGTWRSSESCDGVVDGALVATACGLASAATATAAADTAVESTAGCCDRLVEDGRSVSPIDGHSSAAAAVLGCCAEAWRARSMAAAWSRSACLAASLASCSLRRCSWASARSRSRSAFSSATLASRRRLSASTR